MHTVTIHTDGACEPNPGQGGWAAVLQCGNSRKEIYGSVPDTTNNRMEMEAALQALKALKKPCEVTVYSDSKYLVEGMTKWTIKWQKNNWKRRNGNKKHGEYKNLDLWQALVSEALKHRVSWEWIKGHSTNAENNRADALAEQAALAAPL